MRLTKSLFKFNSWRLKKSIWQVQRKRTIINSKVKEYLEGKNIHVVDANDVASLPKPFIENLKVVGQGPFQFVPGSENDPHYNNERISVFKDINVLLEGLAQAKLLLNTIEPNPENVLPSQVTNLIDAVTYPEQDNLVKKCIKSSLIFDAEQVKLPIRKDPERPMWVFPRDYGISIQRKSYQLCKRLVNLCELISQLSGLNITEERLLLDDAYFSVPIVWNGERILFELTSDLLVTSKSVLSQICDPETYNDVELPNIEPLLPTVSLEKSNSYLYKDIFPIKNGLQHLQVHTAIVHYNDTEVRNLYGERVTDNQILSRSLIKAYAFAVAQARQNFGFEVKGKLPKPITVQTIHTNTQWFHFSVFQLNTLDLTNTSMRNYYWSSPVSNLFSSCGFNRGRPELKGYNPEVFRTMLAFYNNVL